jgi:signal transduction histidine kinase
VRPLDGLTSIKAKLSVVILAAVAVTVGVHLIGLRAGISLLVLGVSAGALSLGLIHVLARGMTSPLREMSDAARSMARGDYSRRVTATSRDEVGELARAFNTMAGQLGEVDRIRRDLVANVSHELRTPIGALQAVLENLVDGVEPPDELTLRAMLNQVQRLGGLVSQLLDLSRLESGAIPLETRRFRVRDLLEQAAEESSLRSSKIRFAIWARPEQLEIEADAGRLHQVLANLIDNAVRHSPNGGRIELSADGTNGAVTISVADEGPGISEGEAARVFERFYRSDAARSHADGGTGLGLAIARWIVDMHGGDIRVENARPKGCRMVVTLPTQNGKAAS